VAAGAGLIAKGQPASLKGCMYTTSHRAAGPGTASIHLTHYTPLQDYSGIITPAPVHFVQQHSSEFSEIDADQHRLTIHGMVDRPLEFHHGGFEDVAFRIPGSFRGVSRQQLSPDP